MVQCQAAKSGVRNHTHISPSIFCGIAEKNNDFNSWLAAAQVRRNGRCRMQTGEEREPNCAFLCARYVTVNPRYSTIGAGIFGQMGRMKCTKCCIENTDHFFDRAHSIWIAATARKLDKSNLTTHLLHSISCHCFIIHGCCCRLFTVCLPTMGAINILYWGQFFYSLFEIILCCFFFSPVAANISFDWIDFGANVCRIAKFYSVFLLDFTHANALVDDFVKTNKFISFSFWNRCQLGIPSLFFHVQPVDGFSF